MKTFDKSWGLLAIAMGFAGLLGLPATVAANLEIQVNSEEDAVDTVPGDGVCLTSRGVCTLRAAVMESNATSGHDMIHIPAGRYQLQIPSPVQPVFENFGDAIDDASHGDLDLLESATISGAGTRDTIVDGNGVDRVFNVDSDSGSSVITDLTITRGYAKERNSVPQHTGGGGIANGADLTLRRVTVTGNVAGFGGGIFNTPSGTLTLEDSTVSNNVAGEAGGIRFDAAGYVINSTISGNRVYNFGEIIRPGGLAGRGGGIDIRGRGPVEIVNSTITDNLAPDEGGGLNISYAYSDVVTSTVTDQVPEIGGVVTLQNTVVAGNYGMSGPSDCGSTISVIESRGNNLDSDGSCNLDHSEDRPSTKPQLGVLANNGGPTDTHLPRSGSPLIDGADDGACPDFDQRGESRPQGQGCDIGSVEVDLGKHDTPRHNRPERGPLGW